MSKQLAALLSVLSLVIFVGAGCGGDDESKNTNTSNSNSSAVEDTTNESNTNTEEAEEETDEEAEAEENETYSLGDEAIIGDVSYTVTKFELLEDEIPTEYHNYPDTIGEPKPADAGRDWLRVEFSVTNNGDEKVSTFGSNFIVENADGQKIESSNDATSYAPTDMNPVLESDIQSGATKDYILYFDIPEDSKELVFHAPDLADAFNEDASVVTFMLSEKATDKTEEDESAEAEDSTEDTKEEVEDEVEEVEDALEDAAEEDTNASY